jgi:hypothetical protein
MKHHYSTQNAASSDTSRAGHVAVNLRQVLEKSYGCDGSLPAELSEQLFASNGHTATNSIYSEINEPEYELEKKIITDVLNDVNIPSNEKEIIAKSILQGNFEIQQLPVKYSQHKKEEQRQHYQQVAKARDNTSKELKLLYINRHKLPKPHFLEVVTEAAKIPIVSPKLVHQERVLLLKNSQSLGRLNPGKLAELRQLRAGGGGGAQTNDEMNMMNNNNNHYNTNYNTANNSHLDVGFHDSMESQAFPGGGGLSPSFITESQINPNHNHNPNNNNNYTNNNMILSDAANRPAAQMIISQKAATVFKNKDPLYREQYNKHLEEDRL